VPGETDEEDRRALEILVRKVPDDQKVALNLLRYAL